MSPMPKKICEFSCVCEVIFQKSRQRDFVETFGDRFYTYHLDDWAYSGDYASEILLKHFEVNSDGNVMFKLILKITFFIINIVAAIPMAGPFTAHTIGFSQSMKLFTNTSHILAAWLAVVSGCIN